MGNRIQKISLSKIKTDKVISVGLEKTKIDMDMIRYVFLQLSVI